MKMNQLNPVLLHASHANLYNLSGVMVKRTVYDYELEYFLRSDGGIEVDGVFIPFKAGDINVRKPGQVVCGVAPYEVYILCIDFFGRTDKMSGPFFGSPSDAQPRIDNSLLEALNNRISGTCAEGLRKEFEEILRHFTLGTDYAAFKTRALLTGLLAELFRRSAPDAANAPGTIGAVRRSIDYLCHHYTEPVDIGSMIAKSGCGRAQFHKLFKEYTRRTPMQYIIDLRMDKARHLLALTDMQVGQVALECGYEDNVYFIRLFSKKTGITPGAYRRRGQV